MYLTKELIEEVVNTNDKKRFSFNPDKSLIRANYGHSIDVDLKLKPLEPPLYYIMALPQDFLNLF